MAVTTVTRPRRATVASVAVAASQTLATLAARRGCHLVRLIIQPATTSPGNVILYDGNGSNKQTMLTFPGGASSVAELKPFSVEINTNCETVESGQEGWYVTTGANVSVLAIVQEQ